MFKSYFPFDIELSCSHFSSCLIYGWGQAALVIPTQQTMGSAQSKDKMHCTRYVNGKGPLSVEQQSKVATHFSHFFLRCHEDAFLLSY